MVDWVGLLVPVAYLSILIGSFATFSYLYRRRKALRAANLEPWFPPHLQRNVYLSLLHMDPSDPSSLPADAEKSLKQVPDSIVKAALLRRAVEDIHRIIQVRNAKPALQSLVQRGSVGDELWQRFLRAEQDIEEEVKDVVNEANALAPQWGQFIFQSANEIANNQLAKARMEEMQAKVADEKEWWDLRKKGISEGFMKELDEEASQEASKKGSVSSQGGQKSGGSDEDAVLVEPASPTPSVPTTPGSGGGTPGSKKKKGRK